MKVAAAYIPVVHKGHQEFCRKVKPDILYVLGRSFLNEIAIVERDIRSLDPKEIIAVCKALSLAPDVRILDKKNIPELLKADPVVFADDEVMHYIADSYLAEKKIVFETVFLRWGKMVAFTKNPVTPDIEISKNNLDREFMGQARKKASLSSDWWRQVGGLIVKKGKIVLEGFNQHKPTENSPYIDGDPRSNFNAGEHIEVSTAFHIEAGLIARAARQGLVLKDASMYVTTFPCQNCAMAIAEAGIKKIYYAEGYSNLNAEQILRSGGVKIIRVMENKR